ncbi:hypothetical protein FEM48_Zijuj03G0027800 [Ziziphus jujuba var. spinosa]|uniref:Dof-type domain-containing protein n=1 Tax=Ziziphus jujuba var. spinosa TaxID=714518 RepID=A0A978VMQ3_ZIZJJ|nr:hypothetical protein FEM48_Zijuj03G0027800 [Ziziphus jujuba var. spinosa]
MSGSQLGDPAIKLFGTNIPVPESGFPVGSVHSSGFRSWVPPSAVPLVMDECSEAKKAEVGDPSVEKFCKQDKLSELDNGKQTGFQIHGHRKENEVNHNSEDDKGAGCDKSGKEKALKKPDKVLPCPRCNSLETKFCYFNNYNVNQPRYFCKNCQRYWTAGGTIRNVPVGAGRRRNKHSSPQYHQTVAHADAAPVTQGDTLNSDNHHHPSSIIIPASERPVNGMGNSLEFGTDAPLCESMATVLNLKDHNRSEISSAAVGDNCEEPSSSTSSLTDTSPLENEYTGKENDGSNPTHPIQYYPVPQWTYPWNPGWSFMTVGPDSSNTNHPYMGSLPMMPVPGFCAPNITFQLLPASCWGYMPSWEARKLVTPLHGSTENLIPSSSTRNTGCSGSPTLGKHSRDTTLQAEDQTEQCLWVPKTLRIDDPDEAAKSSIWSTLGIKPDKNESSVRDGLFKALPNKSGANSHTSDADQVLQSNPAAFSRSQSFKENT